MDIFSIHHGQAHDDVAMMVDNSNFLDKYHIDTHLLDNDGLILSDHQVCKEKKEEVIIFNSTTLRHLMSK